MISQQEFIQSLVDILSECSIAHMVSGSIGSSFHGKPRATNDADIVIAPSKHQLTEFLKSISPQYYVSKDAALAGLENDSMFNVIDTQNGWKADLIIRKNRAFSRQEFSRRKEETIMGAKVQKSALFLRKIRY